LAAARPADDLVDAYLKQHAPRPWAARRGRSVPDAGAAAIFDILSAPALCIAPDGGGNVRAATLERIAPALASGAPLDVYLELGLGGRADAAPEDWPTRFEVGLGEWFLLAQVARCAHAVAALHAPAMRCVLVVDNLVAWVASAVPLADSERYCAWLRALIAACGLDRQLSVLVESELFTVAQFEAALREAALRAPRRAAQSDANANAAAPSADVGVRHAAARAASERLLGTRLDGVRLSLQADPGALRFRPYPGGVGRIGAGELCLARSERGLQPVVVDRDNAARYLRSRMTAPPSLPDLIRSITIARPIT